MDKIKVFISYSHNDHAMVEQLRKHSSVLLREGTITYWYDRDILASGVIDDEVSHHLDSSRIFLALVSPDFLSSGYCYDDEMKRAIALHNAGRLRIVPVILQPCDWKSTPLRQFKALPRDGQPISDWPNTNAALLDVVTELRRLIRSLTLPRDGQSAAPAKQPLVYGTGASTRLLSAQRLPFVVFPEEIDRFLCESDFGPTWETLDGDVRSTVVGLGCKLEAIVQIVPVRPEPVLLGFECLALGLNGESFSELTERCMGMDEGALRVCLAIASIKTVSAFFDSLKPEVAVGARNLKFSMNLDPLMLDSPLFKRFLRKYYHLLDRNIIFEVNETTTARYMPQLKKLQADFGLRFAADDLNLWSIEARNELIECVEITKMDYSSLQQAMELRAKSAAAAIKLIRANKIRNKPLVLEGIDDPDYLLFLEKKWRFGDLWGQGHGLDPGIHWGDELQSLKPFQLPGGSFLRKRDHAGECNDRPSGMMLRAGKPRWKH